MIFKRSYFLTVLLCLTSFLLINAQSPSVIGIYQASPDGNYIAFTTSDGSIKLYSVSERSTATLSNNEVYILGLSWKSDSSQFVTSDLRGDIVVWDTQSGSSLNRLSPVTSTNTGFATNNSTGISWNPTGDQMAVSISESPTLVRNVYSGELVVELVSSETFDVAWSPDGKYIVTPGNNIEVWSASTYTTVTIVEFARFHSSVSWKPDSSAVATIVLSVQSNINEIVVFDPLTGIEQLRFQDEASIRYFEWSPNGTFIATSSEDGVVTVRDASTGAVVRTIRTNYTDRSAPMDWLPDNRLVYGDPASADGLTFLDIGQPNTLEPLRLTSLCSPDPAATRVWRVRNMNPDAITFSYDVAGTDQTGSGTVTGGTANIPGEVTFATTTVAGANTIRIFVDGVQQDVKASTPDACNSEPRETVDQRIRLTSLCSDDPTATRRWRVRNTNPYPVLFTYDLVGTQQQGQGIAPAGSAETPSLYFFDTTTDGGANTLRILVGTQQQDVKASSGAQCTG